MDYINACKNIKKENVPSVIDSMIYFGKEKIIDFAYMMADYFETRGKSGITVLADLGCFINTFRYDELVDYELPKEFDYPIKGICLYRKKNFDMLLEEQKQRLV